MQPANAFKRFVALALCAAILAGSVPASALPEIAVPGPEGVPAGLSFGPEMAPILQQQVAMLRGPGLLDGFANLLNTARGIGAPLAGVDAHLQAQSAAYLLQTLLSKPQEQGLPAQLQSALGSEGVQTLSDASQRLWESGPDSVPVLASLGDSVADLQNTPENMPEKLAAFFQGAAAGSSASVVAGFAPAAARKDAIVGPVPTPSGKVELSNQARSDAGPTRARREDRSRAKTAVPEPLQTVAAEDIKKLIGVRNDVRKANIKELREQLGGDAGDKILHKDVERVLNRLTKAAGLAAPAALVFIGNTFIPQAFTEISSQEMHYAKDAGSLVTTQSVANIFLSMGLLRAVESEDQLAFVLAHELQHNLLGHLKDVSGTNMLLGHFQELEADAGALKLMAAAGYQPEAGLDTLYALDREYTRLRNNLSLLQGDQGELAQTLGRLRDIHPHSDLRRAYMLDHLDEALEAQTEKPAQKEAPVWLQRRSADARPSHLDRYEARLNKSVKEGAIAEGIHALEEFVAYESSKRNVETTENAVIEEAYRKLVSRAANADELRAIQVSVLRQQDTFRTTRRLNALMITRQVELVIQSFPQPPTLEEFLKVSGTLNLQTRRAATLRILGSIRGRRGLDAAYRALATDAESLGFDPSQGGDHTDDQQDLSRRLWHAAGDVLGAEKGRPALPEEIIDELLAKLPPSWLKSYRVGFLTEIVDTAFGPQARRSPSLSVYKLGLRLYGQSAEKERVYRNSSFGGDMAKAVDRWSTRHYRPITFEENNNHVIQSYERYYIDGLSAPSPEDQLEIGVRYCNSRPPLPFQRILRKEGKEEAFLKAALAAKRKDLEEDLKEDVKPRKDDEEKRTTALFLSYTNAAFSLLDVFLVNRRDPESIRATTALVWDEVKATLKAQAGSIALDETAKRNLEGTVLRVLSNALRLSVVQADVARLRFQPKALEGLRALVQDIETTLDCFPGEKLLALHLRNLSANLRDDGTYMLAFNRAIYLFVKSDEGLWARLKRFLFGPRELLLLKDDEKKARRLDPSDFIHFLLLAGKPGLDADSRTLAVSLLDQFDGGYAGGQSEDQEANTLGPRAAQAVGRWLLEDAVAQAGKPAAARFLAERMLRLSALQPALLQEGRPGSVRNAFRSGAGYFRRSEPILALSKREHPFRGERSRWALAMMKKLDETGAWPQSIEERLDLLDFLDANGEFTKELDQRIVETAQADHAGFLRWAAMDEKRLTDSGMVNGRAEEIPLPGFGINVPLPMATPLRIVRNHSLRVQLFDLLPEFELGEKAPRRALKAWVQSKWRLVKAYRGARRYFSAKFLKDLRDESSLREKMLMAVQEADRIGAETARQEREGRKNSTKPMTDRDEERLREEIKNSAIVTLWELARAFAGDRDPVLSLILENFPEPTRARDELLERLIKARKLKPGALGDMQAYKSHRMPNPFRVVEKHLMDTSLIQMRKFSPRERVDIILDLAHVKPLSKEREREFNGRILNGERKKLSRNKLGITKISALRGYLDLLHPKERGMMVRAQFYGDTLENGKAGRPYIPLSKSPRDSYRLYLSLVVKNRKLPPFLQEVFKAYYRILSDDERSRLLSEVASLEGMDKDLGGPGIVRVALKGMGVTGAKVAQVLATHRGLLPPEYAAELEAFKDRAQDLEKQGVLDTAEKRMQEIAGSESDAGAPDSTEILKKLSVEALPKESESVRRRIVKQVDFLLRAQNRRVRWVQQMGPELGAGSIKVVYKVGLDDGRTWVLKLRAPGAAHKVEREFEILDQLETTLSANGVLKLPGAKQLLGEVKTLVRAEMDFTAEAAKEAAMVSRGERRPWYARFLVGPAPFVPRPHGVYVGKDLMVEEFIPSTRFASLPRSSWFGASQEKIARSTVLDGMFSIVYDGWLEPDPHSGNRQARNSFIDRFLSRLVVLDLGQGKPLAIEELKPLLKAGLALDNGDAGAAARALVSIVNTSDAASASAIEATLKEALLRRSDAGVVERLMDALLEAEKSNALVKPEYGALEKAFIIYAGYSPYLPKDFLFNAMERALAVRLLRDRAMSWGALAWLGVRRLIQGRAAVQAELNAVIDGLKDPPSSPPNDPGANPGTLAQK